MPFETLVIQTSTEMELTVSKQMSEGSRLKMYTTSLKI